jgi:dipicolinate synthase subunit A
MFWIIGGDDRSFYTAQALQEAGCSIRTFGVPHMQDTEPNLPLDRVVLPFPSFSGGAIRAQEPIPLSTLLPFLHKNSRIYGGLLGAQKEALSATGAEVIDLYDAEPLTTENAVPTVEGALALAISHSPMTLHGSACLVIGAGRIGFFLFHQMKKMSAYIASLRQW